MATPFEPQSFLKTLVALPGVYRMLDERGVTLYVGKARNLRQRVASYFRDHQSSAKTRSLVAQIQAIEVTVTHTEAEALILESRLIKELQPRYNILHSVPQLEGRKSLVPLRRAALHSRPPFPKPIGRR